MKWSEEALQWSLGMTVSTANSADDEFLGEAVSVYGETTR